MNKYRSHNCSELTEKDVGKIISLSGWLHRKRDHGNLLFIDLRDHFGLTQCVIENNSKFFSELEKLRPESVLTVTGKVIKREKGTENLELSTGKIEMKYMTAKEEDILTNQSYIKAGVVLDKLFKALKPSKLTVTPSIYKIELALLLILSNLSFPSIF